MNLQATSMPYRALYIGALAYAISSCSTISLPTRPQREAQTSFKDNIEVGLQYEGVTREWVTFSTVISNYSELPVEVQPHKIYRTNTLQTSKPLPDLPAISPEAKIRDYQNRIIKRESANKTGKTVLLVLGIVIVVGLLVAAAVADAKDAKDTNAGSSNTPRNSNQSSSQSIRHNSCQEVERTNLENMTTLIGGLGQIIASVRYCEQGYTTASGLQKLQFMKNFWEQEALRPVTLQPNQRVKGFIFFPRNAFKTNQFEIVLTLANSAHIFPFSLPAR